MENRRRQFLKITGLTGLSLAGGLLSGFAPAPQKQKKINTMIDPVTKGNDEKIVQENDDKDLTLIGLYGAWAAGLNGNKLPSLSFRNSSFTNLDKWRVTAKQKLTERLGIPDVGGMPDVKVDKQYTYDGLHIEELSWQLPYGRPTKAILLKPVDAKGPLPGILAFHDHAANKYFGAQKITRTSDHQLPVMDTHQEHYYENKAWANEIAKKGYVVLVSDAFPFASRRVMLQDVPVNQRRGLSDPDEQNAEGIQAYNDWASDHEHIMAKSLFSGGTTWPGVFIAEDRKALDILCARKDVDPNRIGCGGLSGGGMRTVFTGGLDPRIKCAVCVGFMTTWKDFIVNKSFTHTWMTYVPILPKELEFPEILALRAPLPTLVLNDSDDNLYTLPEMQNADNILKEVYKKANASDHYKALYYPGPHKFDVKMQEDAFAWFDKWLKA